MEVKILRLNSYYTGEKMRRRKNASLYSVDLVVCYAMIDINTGEFLPS
jgi:hypothetical protein